MRVAIIGEAMIDLTAYDAQHRANPERADVPTLRAGPVAVNLGGAGNVAAILAARGHDVTLLSPVAGWAECLVESCCNAQGVALRKLLAMPTTWQTPVKCRVFAESAYRMRIDAESCPPVVHEHPLQEAAQLLPDDLDVLIFSDYGKGLHDDHEAAFAIDEACAKSARYVADFKPQHCNLFHHMDAVTPNQREAEACGWKTSDEVRRDLDCYMAFVTLGDLGCAWADENGAGRCPIEGTPGAWHVGAGDAFTAGVAECLTTNQHAARVVAAYANQVACAFTQAPRVASMFL